MGLGKKNMSYIQAKLFVIFGFIRRTVALMCVATCKCHSDVILQCY